MQLKFTQKKIGLFAFRIIAVALILGATTHFSFSQQRLQTNKVTHQSQAEKERQKLEHYNALKSGNIQVADRNVTSVGPSPVQAGDARNVVGRIDANPDSRAFIYNGAGPFQLNKQSVLNTTLTPVGATVTFGFPGAMALQTTTGKLFVVDQAAPFSLYYVDTVTGSRIFVVNCTGVPHANLTGITWDPSTNTMYGVSSSISASQIFTINLSTGVCTPIGSPTAVAPGCIQVNAAPGGSLFSVDIVNDALYRWNKTTGVPTLIGPLGLDANFGQDGHFDFSDGTYYWAAYNNSVGQPQLRIIDTTNGSSTLVGSYVSQASTLGIYSPAASACSGTPNPGNTEVSSAAVCPTAPFALTLQNFTNGTGVTYQWQSAASSSGPWTNVGPNSHIYVTSISTATWFRCQVTCSGNTGTSTPVQVMLNAPTSCYCAAGATSTAFEKISRVQFNTIDNASTSTAGYENFTAISTTVFKGQTLPMTVTISGGFSSDQVLVWIDFNQNGSFTDPGEQVWVSGTGVGPHTGNITIPATAATGTTRMRIRMHDSALGPNSTPCGNSTYGQVEDYTVNIQPCIPITFTTHPSSTSVTCGSNATFTVATAGSAPSYSWEYRVNSSSTWLVVPNSGIYSGANTATLTLTNVSAAYSGYQYRALVTGACSALDFSNTATLTVTPIIPVVNPSSATICTGTIQQLTLTNTTSAPNTVTFNGTGLPLAIPDNNTTGVTTSATVSGIPAGSVINNVRITFSMTHTWVGDIVMNLKAPNGQTLNLIGLLDNGTGSNGTANFVNTSVDTLSTTPMSGAPAPRTGVFRADRFTATIPTVTPTTTNNWLPLLGTMNGNWTLGICDAGAGDLGNLTSWNIAITYTAPTFAQGVWTGNIATMWTDPAATVQYVAGTPLTTIYVNPTATTSYGVSFTTLTPCTSAVTTVPVNVVNPVTSVVSPTNKSVCVGGNTSFSVSASGGPIAYQWQVSLDGGTTWSNVAGATSATLNLTAVTQSMNNNRYRVLLTAAPCAGTTTSGVAILTVNPLPTVTISATDVYLAPTQTTTITGSSTPAAASGGWVWTLNGSGISGNGNTQTVNVDGMGVYQATVTDVNGCVNTSNELVIGAEASDKLWIYPNPTTGSFQVRLYYDSDVAEKRVITIYNMQGQSIMSKEFTLVNNTPPYLQMDFDLGHIARGTYVVKVAHKYTGKVVSGLVLIQ